MNVITSRLPLRETGRRLPRSIARLGPLNIALGAALVGAGVGSYFAVAGTSSTPAAVRTATVQKGVVLSTTSATGTLQAAQELSVGFTTAGTVTAVDVKPGERVKRGQALGRIDSTSAQQALQQAQASLANAQANYEQTLTGETAIERKQDALSVTQSKQSLANAKASQKQDSVSSAASVAQAGRQMAVDKGQEKLDLYTQKNDQAKYPNAAAAGAAVTADQAQLASDQAKQQSDEQSQTALQHQQTVDKANLSQAQTDLQQATTAKDTVAEASDQSQVNDFQSAVNNDQNELDALSATLQNDGFAITADNSKISNDQAALTALQNDTKTIRADETKIASDRQSIASARMSAQSTATRDKQSVASAKLALTTTRASIAAKQAPPTPAALTAAKSSVLNAQIGVVNAQKALDDTILRAPIAGTVASVSGVVGTAESGGGNSAVTSSSSSGSSGTGGSSGSSGFVTLTGITGMQLVAGFAETDTAKLRVGQTATVTVDALPTAELAAHIIAIDGTASSSSGVVTYNVTFQLDRSVAGLKSGMTGNVDVVVGEADNVLHVPTAAVTGSGANASVTVLRSGKQVRVPVVAGLQGDSSTAILSGLKNNETVVLPSVSLAGLTGSAGTGTSTTSATTGRAGRFGGGGATFFGGGGFGG
ncbi:MAG TPA: biotin/lipoyl-binding protein [Gaiellaceae bacterium]|nr:biotin/lipoyl-binding protein [Gaiellaceae bacterium]